MRHWMTFALAMFVSFAVANTADAKKPKPTETEATADAAAPLTITTTGIAAVDGVFTPAGEILGTISGTKTALDNVSKNLTTALGLADGTPLKDALASLKEKAAGKLTVAMNEQGMPELKPSDALPEDVQKALDGFNASIGEISALVPKLAEIPQKAQEVVAAAQALVANPSSLASSGVKPTEIPKVVKAVKNNITVLGKLPTEAGALTTSLKDLATSVQGAFAG